tara:strand:- start:516 stop:2573 length:2058 start_codon:yes stop_codon:yes gene_type:complete
MSYLNSLKFRILIESENGKQMSYETSSLSHHYTDKGTTFDDDPTIVPTAVMHSIHRMVSCSYKNSFDDTDLTYDIAQSFGSDSFLEARLKGHTVTGSIQFLERPFISRSLDTNDGKALEFCMDEWAGEDDSAAAGTEAYNHHYNHNGVIGTQFVSASHLAPQYYSFEKGDSFPYSGSAIVRTNTETTYETGNYPCRLSTNYTIQGPFTINIWLIRGDDDGTILLADGTGKHRTWFSGDGELWMRIDNWSKAFETSADCIPDDGNWYMLTITRTVTDNITIYRNGVDVENLGITVTPGSKGNRDGNLVIDNLIGTGNGSYPGFPGKCHSIAVWSRCLSQDEILAHHRRAFANANTTYSNTTDRLRRYKFFGNKVCNVLGLAENTWYYANEDFRLSIDANKPSHMEGSLTADYLSITRGLNLSNISEIGSDIPFRIKKTEMADSTGKDRWLKFTHYPDASTGNFPNHDLVMGYDNTENKYKLKGSGASKFYISGVEELTASDAHFSDIKVVGGQVTASGGKFHHLETTGNARFGNADGDMVRVLGDMQVSPTSYKFDEDSMVSIAGSGTYHYLTMGYGIQGSANNGFVMPRAGHLVAVAANFNVTNATVNTPYIGLYKNGSAWSGASVMAGPFDASTTGWTKAYATTTRGTYEFNAGDILTPVLYTTGADAISLIDLVGTFEVLYDT